MKKVLLATALLTGSFAFAQKTVTPSTAAKAAFDKKYPAAADVKWGKENKNEYEAEFTLNGTKMAANFLTNGKWVVTETSTTLAELPQAVQTAFKSKHATATLVEKIEKPGAAMAYEIEYKSGKKNTEIVYDANGKEVKEKKEKEEKGEKDEKGEK